MTLQHFLSLPKHQKQYTVLSQAMLIAERTDGPFQVMLYQLDDFYVEVYLCNPFNKVVLFKAFDNLSFLEPYLQSINISGLLQEVFS